MGSLPQLPSEHADLSPNFAIDVAGHAIGEDITQFIKKVEYESVDGMADEAKMIIANPDFKLTDAKIFQPGNELSIFFGYGTNLDHVGRTIIKRVKPNFPKAGMPSIEIQGYTKDASMMTNAPEKPKDRQRGSYEDMIDRIASSYGMELDFDDHLGNVTRNVVQKAGMSDYDVIFGIANLTGSIFWVDGDASGKWTLHFKDGDKGIEQDKRFTFRYNQGDLSTLLTFRPEMLTQGAKTKIKVMHKDPVTGRKYSEEFEEKNDSEDVAFDGDTKGDVQKFSTPQSVKVYMNDLAFDLQTQHRFKDAEELKTWAQQWFRKQRENFVLAEGDTVGVETLRAREIHAVEGVSAAFDGDYYLHRVRHVFDAGTPYACDFSARKVLG